MTITVSGLLLLFSITGYHYLFFKMMMAMDDYGVKVIWIILSFCAWYILPMETAGCDEIGLLAYTLLWFISMLPVSICMQFEEESKHRFNEKTERINRELDK